MAKFNPPLGRLVRIRDKKRDSLEGRKKINDKLLDDDEAYHIDELGQFELQSDGDGLADVDHGPDQF